MLNFNGSTDFIFLFLSTYLETPVTCLFALDSVTVGLIPSVYKTLSHTDADTRSQRYSSQWITGGCSRPRLRAVLPCDSPHTSTLLSRKLKWKCRPWKSVAPIYLWTRANDLSFLSGAQAAALPLTLTLHQRAGRPHQPRLYSMFQFQSWTGFSFFNYSKDFVSSIQCWILEI